MLTLALDLNLCLSSPSLPFLIHYDTFTQNNQGQMCDGYKYLTEPLMLLYTELA